MLFFNIVKDLIQDFEVLRRSVYIGEESEEEWVVERFAYEKSGWYVVQSRALKTLYSVSSWVVFQPSQRLIQLIWWSKEEFQH